MSSGGKVSSLRLRIERVRATFNKKMDLVKLGLGLMVVVLAAVGLYVTF